MIARTAVILIISITPVIFAGETLARTRLTSGSIARDAGLDLATL